MTRDDENGSGGHWPPYGWPMGPLRTTPNAQRNTQRNPQRRLYTAAA